MGLGHLFRTLCVTHYLIFLHAFSQTKFCCYQKSEVISGVSIPRLLVGDTAYPLLPWLMKGFSDNGKLTSQQVKFNYQLSRARMVVECAFGRLKGRFRCLLKRNDTTLQYLPMKVVSCCVLHNLCELRNEAFLDEWSLVREPESNSLAQEDDPSLNASSSSSSSALVIRNALVDYFATKNQITIDLFPYRFLISHPLLEFQLHFILK